VDLKQLEKLMASMERAKIRRLAWKGEGFEIELERETRAVEMALPLTMMHPAIAAPPTPERVLTAVAAQAEPAPAAPFRYITSPMVGTFYAQPSPEDPPFVRLGDSVEEEKVVCIIEAMKVMNEVKAQVRGTIAEILLKNGDPVEFGTKIFKVAQ
jgi:acetyl-CoA carboxylase biotin carboxyl carrier protein